MTEDYRPEIIRVDEPPTQAIETEAPPEPPRPTFLNTVNPVLLWLAAALLTVGAALILFIYLPSQRTDLQKRSVRTEGSVLLKDAQVLPGDRLVYNITFVYPDERNVNHTVTNTLTDAGLYEDLAPGKYVRVRYLPENPELAYMEGAQAVLVPQPGGGNRVVSVTPPGARALSFLGWSLLLGSLPVWMVAYLASHTPRVRRTRAPRVTVTRR